MRGSGAIVPVVSPGYSQVAAVVVAVPAIVPGVVAVAGFGAGPALAGRMPGRCQ